MLFLSSELPWFVEHNPFFFQSQVPESLVRDVSLAALRLWLDAPGSDVEKALRKAMRAKHAALNQATRAAIAQRVLGIAVFHGRLVHLLDKTRSTRSTGEASTEHGGSLWAELLLELFVRRELREEGEDREEKGQKGELTRRCENLSEIDEQRVSQAVQAPLFEAHENAVSIVSLAQRLAVVWSLPLWMAESWLQQFGVWSSFALGRAMSRPARVTLRVNTFNTSRLALMEMLMQHGIRSIPTGESPYGLWLPDGRPPGGGVWQLPGYSEGLFEVQDEGSQLLALATEAKTGECVVDYLRRSWRKDLAAGGLGCAHGPCVCLGRRRGSAKTTARCSCKARWRIRSGGSAKQQTRA